jgi:dUTP pyrophosphatase
VIIRYTTDAGVELRHGHDGDAGIDLPCSEAARLWGGTWTNVPIGIRVELPAGVWGLIVGRSSTFFRKHLMVNQAIIDNGYRGELFVSVYNPGEAPYDVDRGERLAQLIPMLLVPTGLRKVDELSDTVRGSNGFGSTG